MVLTTELVCLLEGIGCTVGNSRGVSRMIGCGLAAMCLVLLTGCGTGDTAGDGLLAAGAAKGLSKGGRVKIVLSPTSLSFSAVQGGSEPAAQAVAISNSGNGTVDWSVSTSAPWIALTPLAGTTPGSFNVTAIAAGLAAGSYAATIIVSATGVMNSPQTIPVTMTVSAPSATTTPPTSTITPGTISLSPASLSFSAIEGGTNPAGQAVAVSNSGGSALSWSVSTTASWLALSPGIGTAPSSFNATADISGLVPGTYSTTIIVSSTGATNTPQTIPVTVTVSASSSTSTTPTTSTSTEPASTTTTGSVSLAWDPVIDPSVTGYYVHYGMQSPNSSGSCAYEQSIYYPLTSLANSSSPSATISNLTAGTTYYFAVSANNGLESACSNEVSKAM